MLESETPWSLSEAEKTYLLSRWGGGYFRLNEHGHISVLPEKDQNGPSIDIMNVVDEVQRQGLSLPAVLRFHDILHNTVADFNKTFASVIEESGYGGKYKGVFPIKVNQLREVVEEILEAGEPYSFGLEAGSKAELMIALAYNTHPEALTILNGYKDRDYMRLALLGRKIGRNTIVVIEKLSELNLLLDVSKEMNIEPCIGLRVKVATKGSGKWCDSGGDCAKFGLSIPEILHVHKQLKESGQEHLVKLLHFHIGSQITDIKSIKEAVTEGARVFCKLKQLGMPLELFDVGGGLGVDYDGSRSLNHSSKNYSTKDYIQDVVYILKSVCDAEEVEHPDIVSESGRSLSASHSMVVFDVFGSIANNNETLTDALGAHSEEESHSIIKDMEEVLELLKSENAQESYNDISTKKEEALDAFKLGIISLEDRARAEALYWKTLSKIKELLPTLDYVPGELAELDTKLAETYLCNFSLFQSLADAWAIEQIFPIVPLHRHLEKPTKLCTLADITCDSDGKINKFFGRYGQTSALPVHPLVNDEPYYIGIFLTGAYQDIMGDMHNLFGRLNEIHVFCDDDDPEDFYIEEVVHGHKVSDVLSIVQYLPAELARALKTSIDREIRSGKIRPREGVKLTDFYESCLYDYTYLGPRKSPIS